MSGAATGEQQQFSIGRGDLRIPAIDELELSTWGVHDFFQGMYELNFEASQPYYNPDDPDNYELVVPAEAEKPLLVFRGTHQAYGNVEERLEANHNQKVMTAHSYDAIFIPPQAAGSFSSFLRRDHTSWSWVGITTSTLRDGPIVEFKNRRLEYGNAPKNRSAIKRALEETVELLAC